MNKFLVTKYNGEKEPYNAQKVLSSIFRSGVKREKALKILARVEKKLYPGISTEELYQIVGREIIKEGLTNCSHLYRLREALALMDSIDFEKFVKEILASEGYQSKWNLMVNGFCSQHQLDVLAQNQNGQKFFVEVKHHRNYHRDTDLGTTIEVWGRLDDLRHGHQKGKTPHDFVNAWLITNTKFSAHAKKYASCKKIRLMGWRYGLKGNGLVDPQSSLEEKIKQIGLKKVTGIVQRVIGQSKKIS